MKTEKQIEEMARLASIDFHEYENHYFIIAFIKGHTQAQKDLLSEASEGFDEWFGTEEYAVQREDFPTEATYSDLVAVKKEAWQASRLSMMKENEELKKYKGMWQSIAGKANLQHLVKENEELRGALDTLTNPRNLYLQLDTIKANYRTKFNLDKNDKGAV